jgi:hypothetical protein
LNLRKTSFPVLLSAVLTVTQVLGQEAPPPSRIDLVVVGGEGAVIGSSRRATEDPSVRVEDPDHKPVRGAIVTFNLPVSGTSGEFEKGAKNTSITTGDDGLATVRGLKSNGIAGRLQILITASYRGQTARGLITQTVEGVAGAKSGGGGGSTKILIILAVAAAAAGGGIYAATHGSSSSSSSNTPPPTAPIGITPGTGTVAHP